MPVAVPVKALNLSSPIVETTSFPSPTHDRQHPLMTLPVQPAVLKKQGTRTLHGVFALGTLVGEFNDYLASRCSLHVILMYRTK